MRRSLLSAVVLAGLSILAGCGSSGASVAEAERDADGLLNRPDLQAIVDLQVLRDGTALTDLLASPDSLVRARAAFALGSVQDEAAIPALRRLLDDPVPGVREDAAFALGQTADSTVGVPLVVSLRREATPAVLAELLDALGKTGVGPDLSALLGLPLPSSLDDERALALARFGIRGVTSEAWAQWLGARLQSDQAMLRQRAAYAFTRSPVEAWRSQAEAIRAAFDALPDDPARADLARALARLADPADTDRLSSAALGDADWRTRVNAVRALDAIGTLEARGTLARAVDDPVAHVAQAAASALATAGAPEAVGLAAGVVSGDDHPWQVQAAFLPALSPSRPDLVLAWAERQPSPFAQAAALRALGASEDGAALTRLFTDARSDDTRLASAALGALRQRWDAGGYGARRFYEAFSQALRRADLATTSTAATALADSAFWPLGSGTLLRETYASLTSPADLEPMTAILSAAGQVRDGGEVDFLVGVALNETHPVLREAARDALNDRLVEGVEVTLESGDGRPPTTTIDWRQLAVVGSQPRLILDTDRGRVVVELDTEAAPQTVQRISTTAAAGLYDDVPFHRVVANFVVQGGDHVRRDGYGGPETPIRSEFTRIRYETGTIGMASSGKDTEGSQYFITHSPQPHLDGRYTAFGRVIEGQDVVDALLQGDLVRRARIEPSR
ncbi:MAG: peptidylprolyl isomerase [Bacteroidota bacterium]